MPLFQPSEPDVRPECTIVEWVRRSAIAHPEREAVVCGEQRLSWRLFDRRVNRVANRLIELGVRRGDRVAVLAVTSVAYVEIFMATLRAGACLVPLSTMASAEGLEKMIIDSGALTVSNSEAMFELAGKLAENLAQVVDRGLIAVDFERQGWSSYEEALERSSDSDPLIEIGFEDPFNLIYSSGTTGVPKGILHDHWMRAIQMERVEENGYADRSRTLLSTPLYSNTTIVALLPTLVGGGTVVLMRKFDARNYLQLVERERCTHTMLVPVQYKRIMDLADFGDFDLTSMRMKFSTSAPLRAALKKDVLDRFPGGLIEYYGLTEGGGVAVLAAHEFPDKLDTVGQPAKGVEMKFINDDGCEVPPGQMGEICGRSSAMMRGYFGRDDLTRETLWQDESGHIFFRSGDMGFVDADGFIHLADRKKDMIISGGLNIYADDLERVLLSDDDVEDAAVVAIPSDDWGETPLGLVVLRDGATRTGEDVLAAANAQLGKSQRISDVKTLAALPRSPIGKILKRQLREPYWGHARI